MKELRGAGINCYRNRLDGKICTRLKKIIKFQKVKQKWIVENWYAQRQKVENFVEGKLTLILPRSRRGTR